MNTWRTRLAVGEAQQHMHMDMPTEEAERPRPEIHLFEPKRRGPSGDPAFKVGDKVQVTPDEDDDFSEPFVGTVGQEPSYNDIFEEFVYAVRTPEGEEVSVFEPQVKPSMTTRRKVLAWETVPEKPPGIQQLDYNEFQRMDYPARKGYVEKLEQEIKALQDAGDPDVKEWRGQWYGNAYATATIWARNEDEAKILAREGVYVYWDESTGDDFDFDGVEEV